MSQVLEKNSETRQEGWSSLPCVVVVRLLLCHDPNYCRLEHRMRTSQGHLFNGMPVAFTHKTKKPLGPEIGILVTSQTGCSAGDYTCDSLRPGNKSSTNTPLPSLLTAKPCDSQQLQYDSWKVLS